MSTFLNPRPNPFSRAPNKMRDPFVNSTSCSPFDRRTCEMNGLTAFDSALEAMSRNVSLCVLARWAVQRTSVSGFAIHNANTSPPIVYVFPTCLGMLSTMPPTPHAYLPSARSPVATVHKPTCQGSNGHSNRSRCPSRIGHSVVSIPDGITRCLVTSDSFRSELGFSVDDILSHRLHRPSTQLSLKFLNLITQINLTTHQSSQRRTIRLILNTPSHNKPH